MVKRKVEELFEDIEELPEEEQWYKGPITIILAIFLVLIVVMMVLPYNSIRIDPEPKAVPSLDAVLPSDFKITTYNSSSYVANLHPEEPVVKQVANKIISNSCLSDSKVCDAKALFYFVRDNFKYVNEGSDYIMSSSEMFFSRGDDCDGHAVLLANLLQSVGLNTRFVFFPRHVMIQVWLPEAKKSYKVEDDWIYLDPTCTSCKFGELPPEYIGVEKKLSE